MEERIGKFHLFYICWASVAHNWLLCLILLIKVKFVAVKVTIPKCLQNIFSSNIHEINVIVVASVPS
jgi:dolichol kinase